MRRAHPTPAAVAGALAALAAASLVAAACTYAVPGLAPDGAEAGASRGDDASDTDRPGAHDGASSPDGASPDAPLREGSAPDDGFVPAEGGDSPPPSPDASADGATACTRASIAFQAATQASSAAGAGSIALPTPPSSPGDVMLAFLSFGPGTTSTMTPVLTVPSGWTGVGPAMPGGTQGETVDGTETFYVAWHVATAAEPSTYTWTVNETVFFVAWILDYAGVDPASPIDDTQTRSGELGQTGDGAEAPSATASGTGDVIVVSYAVHGAGTQGGAGALPNGLTSRVMLSNGSARFGGSADEPGALGANGPFSIVFNGGGGNRSNDEVYFVSTIALRPCP